MAGSVSVSAHDYAHAHDYANGLEAMGCQSAGDAINPDTGSFTIQV
jgi:hypothetical protein